jgi:hypothetical protein
LLQNKDMATYWKEFMPLSVKYLPPGVTSVEQYAKNFLEDEPEEIQREIDQLHAIQSENPTMSENGNLATYERIKTTQTSPDGKMQPVILEKRDGLWQVMSI